MGFIQGTKVFTDNGFKNIEDISGQDKVLVRNFIGDAEFIQPFALHKSKYDGEVCKIGGRNWSFSVTPDHIVVYDRDDMPIGKNFNYVPAKDVEVHNNNRIYRKFKYLVADEYKKEQIIIYGQFGKQFVNISNEDFAVLCGYTLCRGQIDTDSSKKPALNIFIRSEEEASLITDILDRIGVEWSLLKSDRFFIRVSNKNNLANRLKTRLGASKRKQMYLTDKIIYKSNKLMADMLIETLIKASIKPETERTDVYQFTCGKELADSLVLLGTLHGYGIQPKLSIAAGTKTERAVVKRDIYNVSITKPTKTYSPTYNKTLKYSGYVYSIDLFDGQVYVKEEGTAVWVNPK